MKTSPFLAAGLFLATALQAQVSVRTDLGSPGKPISTDLMGAFFEDINYGADGGLYAELVQNRSFEYFTNRIVKLEPLTAWSLKTAGQGKAEMTIDQSNPLNPDNLHYLKATVAKADGEVLVQNDGYDGIPVTSGKQYRFSVYHRSDRPGKPMSVRLVDQQGVVLCSGQLPKSRKQWTKSTILLTATGSCDRAALQLVLNGKGSYCLDMVSLFPTDTYRNRENGLRKDLAQAIADLKPRFLRFPGGCVSHGAGNANAYRWKNTVGDVAGRKANWNLWGYHQTYGLGFYEYFQFCEDIGAKPLPVLPLGISCQFRNRQVVPMDEMGEWVQDALDLVEFANGDVNTTWGKVRAEMGHPAPFGLEYVCLGNEEDDIPEFRQHFLLMRDALAKAHPDIKVLGTSGVAASGSHYDSLWEFSRQQGVYGVDEHYYMGPDWFLSNNHRYDAFDRKGPKVFMGEYASQDDRLRNAIAEAAFLTGVERNADIIQFACYAPLLCREANHQWNPDLIRFDNRQLVKTASYHVQQLYGVHAGDRYLDSEVRCDTAFIASMADYSGRVGVGSWLTKAEFDDFKVMVGSRTLFSDDFKAGTDGWTVLDGAFARQGGSYLQNASKEPAWSLCPAPSAGTSYVITLKARKTGGSEGFIIPFAYRDGQNYCWLNIGGWGNTRHAVERADNGAKSVLVSRNGRIEDNRWYDIRIEVDGAQVRCFLDGEVVLEVPVPDGPVTASVTACSSTGERIVKLVNAGKQPVTTDLNLGHLPFDQDVTLTTLTGEAGDRNSLEAPGRIAPTERSLHVSGQFSLTLPPMSFQVFRVKMR